VKTIRSRAVALQAAAMLQRMTGDEVIVMSHYSDKGQAWRLIRTDPTGKEFDV
jgi:hypothetical protein